MSGSGTTPATRFCIPNLFFEFALGYYSSLFYYLVLAFVALCEPSYLFPFHCVLHVRVVVPSSGRQSTLFGISCMGA